MTDYAELEKRLRERSQTVCVAHGIFTESFITPDALCTEAADAIAALTREVEKARAKAIAECAEFSERQWSLHGIHCARFMGEDLRRSLLSTAPADTVTDLGEKP